MSSNARLLFISMICHADDEGRGIGRLKSLKAITFPSEDFPVDQMDLFLKEVTKNTHTVIYDVNSSTYYALLKWHEYQTISHPKPSTIPEPPRKVIQDHYLQKAPSYSSNVHGTFQDDSSNVHGTFQDDSTQLINELVNELDNGRAHEEQSPCPKSDRPFVGPSDFGHDFDGKKGKALARMFSGLPVPSGDG